MRKPRRKITIVGDVAHIPLSSGKIAIIDTQDVPLVDGFTWSFGCGCYARRTNPDNSTVFLHRAIMNPPENMKVDHINGDTLDNRRSNLRVCTQQQNRFNGQKIWGKSKYRGVSWRNNKWSSHIKVDRQHTFLGSFINDYDAALAYNFAALETRGEFASLNK